MDLDETDHRLLQALLEDASRSLRALGEVAGVTAPTVAARIERLEDLGLLGGVHREVTLSRLGTLVLATGPPSTRADLEADERVHRIWEAERGQLVLLALLQDAQALRDFEAAHPGLEVTVLEDQVLARTPQLPRGQVKVTCAECGKTIQDEGIEVKLGGRRYVVCCPSCQTLIRQRFERHAEGV